MKTSQEKSILVVDDNRDAVETLSTLLQVSGYTTTTAHNGYSAVDATREKIPSVIIMDLGMPWMDGFEAARTIRRMPGGKQVPIIAISGNSQEDVQKRALAAGFTKHLSKPLDYDKLARYLEEVA
jgi:CheY-like chemotaxis protein